jgi:N-acetylmuramic acid 6-phosphate etherase
LERSDFFDASISLHSGGELVRGSTRMKAGTATKKALNILSTTAMILMGKVRSGYMVDLDSSNRKLQERAARILADLGRISLEEAGLRLAACQGNLLRALDDTHHSAMKKQPFPTTKESQLR